MSRVDIVFSAPTQRTDGSALAPSEIASCTLMSAGIVVAEAATPGPSMSATDLHGSPASTYVVRTTLVDGTTSESAAAPVEVVAGPAEGVVESAKFYG